MGPCAEAGDFDNRVCPGSIPDDVAVYSWVTHPGME